jgi:hypothetical protein
MWYAACGMWYVTMQHMRYVVCGMQRMWCVTMQHMWHATYVACHHADSTLLLFPSPNDTHTIFTYKRI